MLQNHPDEESVNETIYPCGLTNTVGAGALLVPLAFSFRVMRRPGGFGRMNSGGTTSYTGLDLATGSSASIDADHLRPEADQQDDGLGVQPLITIAGIGIIGALAVSLTKRRSGLIVAAAAAFSAVLLLVGELLMRSRLVDKVAELTTEQFAAGKSAGDFVAIGPGFWLAWLATILGAVLAFVGTRLDPSSSG